MTKIGIIGDIHSNLNNLKNALAKVKERGIKQVIVVGDLQSLEILGIMGSTSVKFSIVLGNADYDKESFLLKADEYKNIEILGEKGALELEGKHIGFSHFPHLIEEMIVNEDYDVVFSGHWHAPGLLETGKTLHIRPGEIAGTYGQPTFCIFDLKNMTPELVLVNSD